MDNVENKRGERGERFSSTEDLGGIASPRANWRAFGSRMRDLGGRMPLLGRGSEQRRRQRQIDQEWERWSAWDNAVVANQPAASDPYGASPGDDPGSPPPMADRDALAGSGMSGGAVAYPPFGPHDAASKSGARRWRLSRRALVVLSLLSIIIGFCATQSILTVVDAIAAGRDAQAQVTLLQGMLKGGNYLDTDTLSEVQTHLGLLQGDLSRLQGDMPGIATHVTTGASVAHLLTMATDLVRAGRLGVDAALILLPHLKGIVSDIGASAATPAATPTATPTAATPVPTAPASSTSASTGPLTLDEVAQAQQDVLAAGALVTQALAARAQVDDAQLGRVGLGKLVALLHKLDALAPQLPTYLGDARTVMAALPTLLGLRAPAHFLLFDMDSDELRPSGGFLGNYALLTVQGGHLVGGVHLKDVITLDCPNRVCPANPIPAQYAWMNIDPLHFGMRDANLSPDFPTSAQLVLQQYQRESGQRVDGVVMITPEIIKDILTVTGPITVAGFAPAVDAKNLQDVLHYYHILAGNNGVTPGSASSGTTQRKVIDTLLGSALLKQFGALGSAKQNIVVRQLLQGFGTKDVQLYLTDPKVEAVLAGVHADAAIPMPAGRDGLMATDANVGATYYNSDLTETVADTITLDAQGNAHHDATLTYTLPRVQHLYTPLLLQHNITWYNDVVRILVPAHATLQTQAVVQCPSGCYEVAAPEAGHQVWAVRIQDMQRGQTVVLHVTWTSPAVVQTVNGTQQYQLQLYRQAGNHIRYAITIKPPAHASLALPLPSPFTTPAKTTPGTAAAFSVPVLLKDTRLTLALA